MNKSGYGAQLSKIKGKCTPEKRLSNKYVTQVNADVDYEAKENCKKGATQLELN